MRVLIVDDDSRVRALGRALVQDAGGTVVGEVGDAEAAVERTVRLEPDLVLMDMRMPGRDGADATRELMALRPRTRVIAWTSAPAAEVRDLLAAGATEHYLKDDTQALLARLAVLCQPHAGEAEGAGGEAGGSGGAVEGGSVGDA
jgi:DNA-binding NarL/FixJ family response regulator